MDKSDSKQLYIVISQTGTILSRILKLITGAEYNHASLCLTPDLDIMYSFGRKISFFPFWGGFVTESPYFGTFKRFRNTKIILLSLTVDADIYNKIDDLIHNMVINRKKYGYNYWGLWLAAFKIVHKSRNRYYCSEFVRDVLQENNINGADKLCEIVEPMHFINLPDVTRIYCGKLRDYRSLENSVTLR